MELSPYVEALRHDLQTAAAAGDDRTRETAGLLSAALDPAVRLCLVEAMTAVADEVTAGWDGAGMVEIRMHGREPQVVVTAPAAGPLAPPAPPPAPEPPAPPGPEETDDGATSRITLRLPEHLKAQVERAAVGEGLSVNAWLVRAVSAALRGGGGSPPPGWSGNPGWPGVGRRFTGFARG